MREYIKNKQKRQNKIRFFLTIIVLILFIISLINVVNLHIDNKRNIELNKKASEAVTEKIDENRIKYNVDFNKLKEQNSDTVAWIKINGTNIEYPVVQSNDNNYYLKRDFNKEYNVAGWIFADYRNKFDNSDKNIVIYGHNLQDDSMFGTLRNILNESWYSNKENQKIILITEDTEFIFNVFSIYQIKNENYYINTDFSDEEYIDFLQTIKDRSITNFDENVDGSDKILTISTCANNSKYRIVLHAKCSK